MGDTPHVSDNTITHATTHCSRYVCTCCLAGRLQHYIKTGEHMKGQPVRSVITLGPGPGVQYCSLETLEVQTVSLFGAAAADWGPHAYESVLELHTGRTHQVHCSCYFWRSCAGQRFVAANLGARQQCTCPCIFKNCKLRGMFCQQCCVLCINKVDESCFCCSGCKIAICVCVLAGCCNNINVLRCTSPVQTSTNGSALPWLLETVDLSSVQLSSGTLHAPLLVDRCSFDIQECCRSGSSWRLKVVRCLEIHCMLPTLLLQNCRLVTGQLT